MVKFVPSWSWQAPDDPAARIDRTLVDRGHRLIAGLHVTDRFDRIDAVLLVTVGHGKYLRVKHVEGQSHTIPKPLTDSLQQLTNEPRPTVAQLKQATADLALVQAELFEQVKCRAGKYVDRILAVAVSDPGLRWQDFDGSPQFVGLCDPGRLSQLTGVTVIDDFPAADIAAGGSGRSLDALPQWLLRADRVNGIAAAHRLVIQLSEHATGYWLPASDGLDAAVPNIRNIAPTPGVVFLDRLLQTLNLTEIGGSTTLKQHELDGHYAQGSLSDTLLESWADCWDTHSPQRCSSRSIAFPTNSDRCDDSNADTIDKLIGVLSEANFRDLSAADILRTAVVWLIQMVVDSVSPVQARVDEVWFSTDTPLTYCLVNQFIQRSGLDVSHVHSAGSIGTLGPKQQIGAGNPQAKRSSTGQRTDDATTTAILGFLHIDQMPASVPSLTTATDQRILGRITPGKPSNWRQLLREMADFHPPAMKLRDAV